MRVDRGAMMVWHVIDNMQERAPVTDGQGRAAHFQLFLAESLWLRNVLDVLPH